MKVSAKYFRRNIFPVLKFNVVYFDNLLRKIFNNRGLHFNVDAGYASRSNKIE